MNRNPWAPAGHGSGKSEGDELHLSCAAAGGTSGRAPLANPARRGPRLDALFRVTTALFTAFYEAALADGAQPVMLLFPARSDLRRWRQDHSRRYDPLLQFLATREYRVIDALTVLDSAGKEHSVVDLIPSHFSPLANRLLAEGLLEELRAFGLVP